MPVGVPKVPADDEFYFKLAEGEEEEKETWIDLFDRLYRERAIFLCQDINLEVTNHIVGLMVFLNLDDHTRDQFLFINSTGGTVLHGAAMHNAMFAIEADVRTIGLGTVASMAAFVLASGTPPKRFALSHSRVMIHQPKAAFIEGPPDDVAVDTDSVQRIRNSITDFFATKAGKPFWIVYEDMERDAFMSPEEAEAYGIVDEVYKPEPKNGEKKEEEKKEEEKQEIE
uniref:ATP-dependent Clp protease proteolytic subunit n=1 Tax=Lobelia thermalis TaxID=2041134 RepID=A0A291F0N4_9ASTR|nr:ATP-dependent protease proteolytic subunit [Lobelia thermalis]ATG25694.1 ATP-dependent protease proteolytic subunit [Lobelia thermalis]